MKKVALILILLAGSLFAQTNEGPVLITIDGYAARAGNTIITYGKIREAIAPFMPQLFQHYQGEELAQQVRAARLAARETLIEEALIREEVKALGLGLPPSLIDEEADRLIRERFNNNRALLNKALAERRMTFEEWREELADQIILRVYYNREITKKAVVSEEAVRTAYEQAKESHFIPLQVKFRAILINKGRSAEDRAVKKQQVDTVLQKLLNGAGFAEMAKEFSEGIRADDGGAFPWKELKDIHEALRPALRTVSTGQLSGLIETDEEFYIVKVEERREEGYVPFEELREQLESEQLALEQKRLHQRLMERLTATYFVERY